MSSSFLGAQVTGGGRTEGRAGEVAARTPGGELGRLAPSQASSAKEELSQSSEKREHRGGGGAAGAAETLGVTEASGTPRPLHSGLKESREPARRRRMVGVGTRVGGGGRQAGVVKLRGTRLSPSCLPLALESKETRGYGRKRRETEASSG